LLNDALIIINIWIILIVSPFCVVEIIAIGFFSSEEEAKFD